MATKRVSPSTKTTKSKKAAAAAPELTTEAAVAVEFQQPLTAESTWVDPDVRRQLVAAEAYFLAERRGFAAGGELEDWVTAEVVVDSRLQHMPAG
jgi:hypothetical protein